MDDSSKYYRRIGERYMYFKSLCLLSPLMIKMQPKKHMCNNKSRIRHNMDTMTCHFEKSLDTNMTITPLLNILFFRIYFIFILKGNSKSISLCVYSISFYLCVYLFNKVGSSVLYAD